jgi:hypothetical protein
MSARLGNVLYWIACIISILTVGIGIVIWYNEGYAGSEGVSVGFTFAAIITWGMGWALRYILAGEK